MKKFYLLAIFVSLFLLAFSLQTGQSFAADPIHVGLMAPMTGDYAEYGMFFKQGMEVAIDQVNKAGGIKGRMIEIVVGDSRADHRA